VKELRVRRYALITTLLVAVALTARPALAAITTSCCACLSDSGAQTSQAPPAPIAALFCGLVTPENLVATQFRCDEHGSGASLQCFPPTPGVSCSEALAAQDISCPAGPGAPVASVWGLGVLAVLLTALGARAARRRLG
jgi:hypothetical protein